MSDLAEDPQPRLSFFTGKGRARDYALTFGTEFSILASTLIVFRLAAATWGTEGFGEYVLARRVVSWLQLPLLLGMSVGITRYVALARQDSDAPAEGTYFVAGLALVAGTSAAVLAVFQLASGPLAYLLLGSAEYGRLARAAALAIAGVMCHSITYSYLRGRLEMIAANMLQFVNLGLVPLGVFLIPEVEVVTVVWATGVLWCSISLATAVVLATRMPAHTWSRQGVRAAGAELLRYGTPRVLGEVALGAMFALPVTLSAHLGGVELAGFVGLGMSLLSMIGSFFAPLGHIFLPAAAMMVAAGDLQSLRTDAFRAVKYTVGLSLPIVLLLVAFASPIIRIYLGGEFEAAVPVVRVIAAAAIPFVVYVVLRNVLDAIRVTPYNTKNLTIGVAVMIVLTFAMGRAETVPLVVALSVAVLGILTARDSVRLLR